MIVGLLDILTLLRAIFTFPTEIMTLVRMLQATPEEKRQLIMEKVAEEAQKYEQTGRPQW